MHILDVAHCATLSVLIFVIRLKPSARQGTMKSPFLPMEPGPAGCHGSMDADGSNSQSTTGDNQDHPTKWVYFIHF